MKFKNWILEFLWNINLYNNCPNCGGELIGHGYVDDYGLIYTCEECGWGK